MLAFAQFPVLAEAVEAGEDEADDGDWSLENSRQFSFNLLALPQNWFLVLDL